MSDVPLIGCMGGPVVAAELEPFCRNEKVSELGGKTSQFEKSSDFRFTWCATKPDFGRARRHNRIARHNFPRVRLVGRQSEQH